MSSKFDGFNEEEINKINGQSKKRGLFAAKSLGVGLGIRRVPDKHITQTSADNVKQKNNRNSENEMKIIKPSTNTKLQDNITTIDYNRKISDESLKELHEAVHFQPLSMKDKKIGSYLQTIQNLNETQDTDESILHLSDERNYAKEQIPQISPFRGISLKDFEAQRKIREEQNKIKKDMLYKAIEKHTQKTAAEVRKIEEIKNELAKLDQDLAADVAILRKQIENACIHYSNIEKHYNKIEQMFLKAKLDLHQASEKKELLTEHLCTVITHNEDRKAKKLSELMDKVGLSATECENVSSLNEHNLIQSSNA